MQARNDRLPTPRQLAKLQKIKNPQQKHVLLAAIGRGEDIPEYAWNPVSSEQMSRALSSPEFKSLFADLMDAARRENRPMEELIGDLDPGWKISHIAEEASSRPFLHSTSQLCVPLTGCVALREAADFSILCTWGFFNPYGPTYENLIGIDSSHGWLLYRQAMNPFSQLDVVYGLPLQINKDRQDPVHAAVAELFASNGGPEVPVLNCLPSYIFDGDEEKLNGMLREHFFAAISLLDATGVAAECEAIRRNWCRPWDLASEHRDRALAEIGNNRAADSSESCSAASSPVAMTAELFDEWWHLVHESDHAIVSFEQMKDAWQGAIEFQAEGGEPLHSMPWEQVPGTQTRARRTPECAKAGGSAALTHGGPLCGNSGAITEINGYKLNASAQSYSNNSLTAFTADSYEWAASHGICRQFSDEVFHWATNNTLFGQKCTEAIIASVGNIIYKIAFRHHAKSESDCLSFREAAYKHIFALAGKEQNRQEFGEAELLLWQSSEGNAILEVNGYDTSILLTSAAIRELARKPLFPRLRNLLGRRF